MKKSRAKTEVLEFRFKNKVRGNGRNHNVRLRGKLINKVKTFKHIMCKILGELWSMYLIGLNVAG